MLPLPASTFEGLFIRALRPTGVFRDALVSAGFDATRMQLSYPVEVWDSCLQVARKELFSALDAGAADFELGQRFNQGFLDTVVGSIIKAGIPLLGLKRLIGRLPRTVPTAFPGAVVTVLELEEKRARVRLASSPIGPDFARGVFHDAAKMAGNTTRFELGPARVFPGVGHDFELVVFW